MSDWTPKRFWKEAKAEAVEGGFTIRLDGRAVKTPAKALLVLPTLALAEAIAAEWDAQEKVLKPETMPLTKAANSAIDKVAPMRAEVIAELSNYGGSDLLCYRATGPAPLQERQAAAWDPLLDWSAKTLDAPLVVTSGIMPVDQPAQSLDRLTGHVAAFSNFELAALHDLVAISGSLVLALATTRARLTASEAFDLSRIDNHWQVEQWGEDEMEAAAETIRRVAFVQADRFCALCR
ncbi:ATP12 family protein [Xinfangfangia sp. CPCC 101601]|uniref:ATP12 family protein n=1 Tax=Pseudogemmobacter lacusdianii TaxID=3069608 RepID=A0ABU0W0Q5_9RHOB|nr:ATP12 family protein [Xinfangfangia sp. CPCC 101601]MDQ2067478.1 ATP12 family protein [Xinfangfangia sp. CPCC 101601]